MRLLSSYNLMGRDALGSLEDTSILGARRWSMHDGRCLLDGGRVPPRSCGLKFDDDRILRQRNLESLLTYTIK